MGRSTAGATRSGATGVIREANGGETIQLGTITAATGHLVWEGEGFTAQQP